MNILLVYPKFPESFWSFKPLLKMVGRHAMMPPLSLITVAALLPQDWNFRLVDYNIDEAISPKDWDWADLVMLSSMLAQKQHMLELIRETKSRGKISIVGGPYPTSVPQDVKKAGANFLVLDEGEITIPLFLKALENGERSGTFQANGETADMSQSPIPRYDLLKIHAYAEMPVQITRGCPFLCEFCDIIILFGRKPRSKSPKQVMAELDIIYNLGWRRNVFFVDDNFIGNKHKVKGLLKSIREWQQQHQFPFSFSTEASVNLADDPKLLDLMTTTNFRIIFIGIETPDVESLKLTKKTQNTRRPLKDQIDTIVQAGLRVVAGLIIGFDGEQPGADKRIIQFVEEVGIPVVVISMLQALPKTHLTNRLRKEGRLIEESDYEIGLQSTLLNFVPTRPVEQIAEEHMNCTWELYEPETFFERSYRNSVMLGGAETVKKQRKLHYRDWKEVSAGLQILWRNGVERPYRSVFWHYFLKTAQNKNLSVLRRFFVNCAQYEHLHQYRQHVRNDISAQLTQLQTQKQAPSEELKQLRA